MASNFVEFLPISHATIYYATKVTTIADYIISQFMSPTKSSGTKPRREQV